jgi:hypothetical protein
MNLPGTSTGNWEWRLAPRELTGAVVARLGALTTTYGRAAARPAETAAPTRIRPQHDATSPARAADVPTPRGRRPRRGARG